MLWKEIQMSIAGLLLQRKQYPSHSLHSAGEGQQFPPLGCREDPSQSKKVVYGVPIGSSKE